MAITKEVLLNALSMYKTHADGYYDDKFVQKESGKGLSTNDFTTALKTKLDGIADGAQVNVIESVTLDGKIQTITNKAVALDLSAYAKASDMVSGITFKGKVENYSALPTTGNSVGDVYNVKNAGGTDSEGSAITAGSMIAYSESGWILMAGSTDLSNYATLSELANYVAKVDGKGLSSNDFTDEAKSQLAALVADSNETITNAEIAALFA